MYVCYGLIKDVFNYDFCQKSDLNMRRQGGKSEPNLCCPCPIGFNVIDTRHLVRDCMASAADSSSANQINQTRWTLKVIHIFWSKASFSSAKVAELDFCILIWRKKVFWRKMRHLSLALIRPLKSWLIAIDCKSNAKLPADESVKVDKFKKLKTLKYLCSRV